MERKTLQTIHSLWEWQEKKSGYDYYWMSILIAYVIDVENENHVMQLKCIFNERCLFNLIEYFIERVELIEYYHTF